MIVEICLARKATAGGPSDLQFVRRLRGLPWLFRDYAHEIVPDNDFYDTGQILHGAFIHADQRCAYRRWPDYSAVQHAGHAYVVHELELAGGQLRKVGALNGFAKHRPLARMFAL